MPTLPLHTEDMATDPDYFEEYALLQAQEIIAEQMEKNEVSKAELARRMNVSKAYVTKLLSSGRNLTLRTLARVLFHMGSEISFQTQAIEKRSEAILDDCPEENQKEKGASPANRVKRRNVAAASSF